MKFFAAILFTFLVQSQRMEAAPAPNPLVAQATAAYQRGIALEKAKRYREAFAEFVDSLMAAPNYAWSYREIGTCQYFMRQYQASERSYKLYLAANPKDSATRALLPKVRAMADRQPPKATLTPTPVLSYEENGTIHFRQSNHPFPDDQVHWSHLSDAREKAEADHKPLLYLVDDNIPQTEKISREMFSDPKFATWIDRTFVTARVQGDASGTGQGLAVKRALKIESSTAMTLLIGAPACKYGKYLAVYENPTATAYFIISSLQELRNGDY